MESWVWTNHGSRTAPPSLPAAPPPPPGRNCSAPTHDFTARTIPQEKMHLKHDFDAFHCLGDKPEPHETPPRARQLRLRRYMRAVFRESHRLRSQNAELLLDGLHVGLCACHVFCDCNCHPLPLAATPHSCYGKVFKDNAHSS